MMTAEMPLISFDHVRYSYPNAAIPALADVSLDIHEGDFVLVCGVSGGGKSTLLRAIAGLVPHFHGGTWQGQVLVAGRDTRTTPPHDLAEHVGFVFQDPDAQFVVDVVEDELAFAMENAGLPQHVMRRRIEEALDQVEIAHLRHRQMATLSGGERQRVAIAAALTVQPKILLLDEPTSQLDPHTAEEVISALHKLNADLGLTIIISEHRLERVAQYVDRIIWVDGYDHVAQRTRITSDQPHTVLALLDHAPPLIQAARLLDWQPLPLTIKAGRQFARMIKPSPNIPRLSEQILAKSAVIEVQHVWANYGDQAVLRDVSLTFHAGEMCAVMGRNGAGKTTLLRHLVGLNRPQRGKVMLHGQDIARREAEDLARDIGFVTQNPSDMLYLPTFGEELRWTLKNHGKPFDQARVNAMLEALGIAHVIDKNPRDLSGGEAQRAALATILVAEPQMLLLDEPTRGLDYAAKQQLAAMLKQQTMFGRSVILVTHDVEFVALCADRIVLLGDGEVVVDGSPQAVLGDSVLFSTQVGKLFPHTGWLTVNDISVVSG